MGICNLYAKQAPPLCAELHEIAPAGMPRSIKIVFRQAAKVVAVRGCRQPEDDITNKGPLGGRGGDNGKYSPMALVGHRIVSSDIFQNGHCPWNWIVLVDLTMTSRPLWWKCRSLGVRCREWSQDVDLQRTLLMRNMAKNISNKEVQKVASSIWFMSSLDNIRISRSGVSGALWIWASPRLRLPHCALDIVIAHQRISEAPFGMQDPYNIEVLFHAVIFHCAARIAA